MNRAFVALTRSLRDKTMLAALSGGSWTLVGTVTGRIVHISVLLAAAATLGSEEFGKVALVLSTVAVVTSISSLGLPVAVQKLVAEAGTIDIVRRERLIDVAIGLTLLVGVVTALVFLAVGPLIASDLLGRDDLTTLLAVASLLVVTTPCIEILAAMLAALERFRNVGILRAVYGGTAGCLLGAVLLLDPGPAAIIGALVCGEALTCVLGWKLLLAARDPERPRGRRAGMDIQARARILLRVSIPAALASISLQPALWIGQVLLSRQPNGLAEVGVFAVALRWQAVALFVPATMGSVLLPMLGRLLATGRTADARGLFVRYGALTITFSTLTCLVLITLAPRLMGLQGREYVIGAFILVVLAIAVVPTAVNNVLSQQALAKGRIALWVWSDIALAASLAISAIVLTPLLHGVGLAVSYLIGYVATCVVLLPVAATQRRRDIAL